MLRYLIKRPISVCMSFLALLLLGIAAGFQIPVGLLPEVDIPKAIIQIRYPNAGARELENTVVRPLRNQLLQVRRLRDINSHTRDGSALIELSFDFGVKADLVFIEINEKVDQLMPLLPRDLERPRILKATDTDLPVFYLSVLPKENSRITALELGELTENVIRRRIEQLPEIAFADRSGYAEPHIVIRPQTGILQSLKLDEHILENAFRQNNMRLGNFLLRDGAYEYNLRFLSEMTSADDIANMPLIAGERNLLLREIAEVSIEGQPQRGLSLFNGREAVIFSIRKQAGARLFDLRKSFNSLLTEFQHDYPQLEFHQSLDQTALLDLSLGNLQDNLIYGLIGIVFITWLFFRDWRITLWVSFTIPLSLSATLLGLHSFGISINIISLAGLILGLGMMIDNSIIVLENIGQKRQMGLGLQDACVRGANEIFTPMLSSTMTTCSVFVPLVFLSGLAGALFYDQAVSISLALGSSVLIAWLLLPVLVYAGSKHGSSENGNSKTRALDDSPNWLTRIVDVCLGKKYLVLVISAGLVVAALYWLTTAPKTQFPPVTKDTLSLAIDWNEPLSLQENRNRIERMLTHFKSSLAESNALLGESQFLLETDDQSINESTVFLKIRTEEPIQSTLSAGAEHPERMQNSLLAAFQHELDLWFKAHYPIASIRTEPAKDLFDQVFGGDRAAVVLHFQSTHSQEAPTIREIQPLLNYLSNQGILYFQPALKEQMVLVLDKEKMMRHDLSFDQAYDNLRTLLDNRPIGKIEASGKRISVLIGNEGSGDFMEKLKHSTVLNRENQLVALSSFVQLVKEASPKIISGNRSGETLNIPLPFLKESELPSLREAASRLTPGVSLSLSGQIFENRSTIRELLFVFAVAAALLYLILAAQFESLILPFVVVSAVTVSLSGSAFLLWAEGQTVNAMTVIGLIVMSGVVVNDSILKVDILNRLSKTMPLLQAIHLGGKLRLRAILATSVPTVLVLLPVLFTSGLGSELQRPLALAVIGGLVVGTAASLLLTPVLYVLIKGKNPEIG